jgi:ornithine cyclodeaminase/alanine dehydrogenase-like protein (mu-crystallin family)
MRILSERSVRNLIDVDSIIEAAEEAFRLSSAGSVNVPLRCEIRRTCPVGTTLIMPGLIGDRILGVKLVGSIASGSSPGWKNTTCVMMLWDANTLKDRGLIACEWLNEHRTAGGFAAASKLLSRHDSQVHVVFGAGKLAFASVLHMARVRPISRVILISRTASRMQRLVENIRHEPALRHIDVTTDVTSAEAVSQADIITTVTTSDTPVFDGGLVRPGTHINLGGSNRADQREMDDAVAARSLFWLDSQDGCRKRAGDVMIPLARGVIDEKQIVGEIGDALLGRVPGRRHGNEITAFKSLGLATQDLVLGARVLDLAEAADAGVVVDLFDA